MSFITKDGKTRLNGRTIMATKASNFDLFSLVDTIINESIEEDTEVSYDAERKRSDDLMSAIEDAGAKSSKKKKSKKKINQSKKRKEEEFDIVDDEEEVEEEEEDKPEPTSINLSDAVSYEKLVDELNMFRAAHSFSDKEIATELKAYFDGLTREEKEVLHILIKGLIHVTLMDVKGKSAKKPSDLNFNIKRSGVTSAEKKKSMNKRISDESKGKKVDSNTPIKVTKIGTNESVQDKSQILKVLHSNR